MKSTFIFLLLATVLSSCFLLSKYKRTTLNYTANGSPATLPILVPKGYLKSEVKDSAGVAGTYYYYAGGAVLYAAYLSDTSVQLLNIDKVIHQPQIHRLGGLVYKGQGPDELYYRQIEQGHFRFGYYNVPELFELHFDSATNYASLQKK